MPDFRRGAAAIASAQEQSQSGGGSFRPFAPQHFWKENGEEKYLLFLNDIEDIPTVDLISFIPQTGKKGNGDTFKYYESVIARTDPALGERVDPMVEDWDGKPRANSVAVAVELEVEYEEVKGRKKPTGFSIKTNEFERRVRDDDGELTDERETVVAPAIGFVTQSPNNFFNVVTAYDANEAPVVETPVKITRVGKDKNTSYTIIGYQDQEVDLTDLIDNIEFVNYLGDEADDLLDAIEGADDQEAAKIIGNFFLDKRLEELADKERYDEIYNSIDSSLDIYGGGKSKGKSSKPASRAASRRERPARATQRRNKEEADPTPAEETPSEPEPDDAPDETPAEKPKARATRGSSKSSSGTNDALAKLRARAEAKKNQEG